MNEITYEELREIQREVRKNQDLIKLPEKFYQKTSKYLAELLEEQQNLIEKTENPLANDLSEQIKQELANAKKIILDIIERREGKIVMKALSSARTGENKPDENMTEEEAKMYEEITKIIREYREKNLKNIFTPRNKEKVLKTIKIKFTEETQAFVWDDEKVYGPYKENQEVELPVDVAEFMVENSKAIIIKEER